MLYYAGCLICMASTLAVMGVDCLRTENTIELLCVLMMTLFFCGVTAYIIVNNALERGGEAAESFVNTNVGEDTGGFAPSTTVAFVSAVQGSAMIVLIVTGRMTYRSFGWRIFKLFGTDKQMRSVFTQLLFAKVRSDPNPNPTPNPNPDPNPNSDPNPHPNSNPNPHPHPHPKPSP